jgi:hypothetical protein
MKEITLDFLKMAWQQIRLANDDNLYADVQKCGEENPTIRLPPPSADLTAAIADAVMVWPSVLVDLIARYVTGSPHSFYAPAVPWPHLAVNPTTVTTSTVTDQNDYAIPWYRCASAWTLRNGCLKWSFQFHKERSGWLAFGVISDDARPITIRQGHWTYALDLGADSCWIRAWSLTDAVSAEFTADVDSYKLIINYGGETSTMDFSAKPDRFWKLRPAVLIAGCAVASFVDPK